MAEEPPPPVRPRWHPDVRSGRPPPRRAVIDRLDRFPESRFDVRFEP